MATISVTKVCPTCGQEFEVPPSRKDIRVHCSEECRYPKRKFHDKEWLGKKYWEEGKSQAEIAEECGVNYWNIKHWMKKLGIKSRRPYRIVEVDLEPSSPLSYVVGVILGDGYVTKDGRDRRVGLHCANKVFALSFKESLSEIGLNPRLYEEKCDMFRVIASSIQFYRWFENTKFNSNHDLISTYPRDFIRGIYESEGSIDEEITIYSTKENNSNLYFNVLKRLGFRPRKVEMERKDKPNEFNVVVRKSLIPKFMDKINPAIKRVKKDGCPNQSEV